MKPGPVLAMFLAVMAVVAVAQTPPADPGDPHQSREQTRTMATATLDRLYALQPAARDALRGAIGYAVFDSGGDGVAVENSIREETFMKLRRPAGAAAPDPGFRQVWLFRSDEAFRHFVGGGFPVAEGTRLEATKPGDADWPAGAHAVAHNVYVYHLTDSGLATSVTLPASSYVRNTSLD